MVKCDCKDKQEECNREPRNFVAMGLQTARNWGWKAGYILPNAQPRHYTDKLASVSLEESNNENQLRKPRSLWNSFQ